MEGSEQRVTQYSICARSLLQCRHMEKLNRMPSKILCLLLKKMHYMCEHPFLLMSSFQQLTYGFTILKKRKLDKMCKLCSNLGLICMRLVALKQKNWKFAKFVKEVKINL